MFGAGGSLATALISELESKDFLVSAFSSREIDQNLVTSANWKTVRSYSEVGKIPDFDAAFILNGYFNPMKISQNGINSLKKTIEVNLLIPTLLVYQIVRSISNLNLPRNVILAGSTSAYEGFAGSADYCAAKHGLVGLIRSLNQEYKETNLRFMLFSFGTIDNPMGSILRSPKPLLSEKLVAQLMVNRAVNFETDFEPEVIIKRRHV